MRADMWIDEADTVIDGKMRVTFLLEILVRPPTIAVDRSAGFEPVTYDDHQSFSGYIRNGNEKRSTRNTFNAAENPLPPNGVPRIIFPPTELALIDFDDHVRTADLLRAFLHVCKHGLSTKLSPIGDGSGTEPMFLFYT
jgi:hypothetical protein